MKGNALDFSFSGLKTAVLRYVQAGGFEQEIAARRDLLRSVPIPSASQSPGGVGQYLRRTAHDIDAFQFALRKEPYRRAVGRPEGIVRSVRSRQRLCGKRIQRPDPELRFAFVRC